MNKAEKLLEKHLLLMLKRTDESYESIDEMKQQPEWQAVINAMLEYGEIQALRTHDVVGQSEQLFFEEQFRVKYLDREDFENLNFTREFATTSDILNAGCEVYKNDTLNLQIVHYRELNKISICSIDFSKNKTKSSWDENQVNLITAKNKSELQYILNRLGFSPS